MKAARRGVLVGVLALGGCHILDQTDIPTALGGAPPVPPPKPPPPPLPSGPRPLVTIRPAPGISYQSILSDAVASARERKADVAFDVVSVVPAIGDPAVQVAAAGGNARSAEDVAQAIVSLGVPASRVSLSARTDAAVAASEIRVYVH